MIRTATDEDLKSLRPDSEAAVKILCLAEAYGLARSFLRFWCNEDRTLFMSLIDGVATISTISDEPEVDFEELGVFLSMQRDINIVRTSETVANGIVKHCGIDAEYGSVLTPGDGLKKPSETPENLSPGEAYPLLKACFEGLPPFDSWYADVSHRLRHGFCRIVGFRRDGIPVSCAMTTSEIHNAAVIGAVATLEQARGKGYASSSVLTLANDLINQGKKVFLSPKNCKAHELYTGLGFAECGRWANIKLLGRN
ncbi:MAG TPA: GNAT family N-acetyltransferase [Candidatus Avimonas sp.]|nr:GNAT family N-acetyltransferase [Candidatus Avimonas sp.]